MDGWGRCHGLSSTGAFVLGRLFRRTASAAALELDIGSAAQRHSDALGRPSAIHLFSDELPIKRLALEWLAEQKLEPQQHDLIGQLASWNSDTARAALVEWAGEPDSGERLADGLRLGAVTRGDLADPTRYREIACSLAATYATLDAGSPAFAYYDLV